jgi:hypothetical protein
MRQLRPIVPSLSHSAIEQFFGGPDKIERCAGGERHGADERSTSPLRDFADCLVPVIVAPASFRFVQEMAPERCSRRATGLLTPGKLRFIESNRG